MVNLFRILWARLLIVWQRTQISLFTSFLFLFSLVSKDRLSATSMSSDDVFLSSAEFAVFREEED